MKNEGTRTAGAHHDGRQTQCHEETSVGPIDAVTGENSAEEVGARHRQGEGRHTPSGEVTCPANGVAGNGGELALNPPFVIECVLIRAGGEFIHSTQRAVQYLDVRKESSEFPVGHPRAPTPKRGEDHVFMQGTK